jgi:hypothetical protein
VKRLRLSSVLDKKPPSLNQSRETKRTQRSQAKEAVPGQKKKVCLWHSAFW